MTLLPQTAPDTTSLPPTDRELLPVLPGDGIDNPIAGRVGDSADPMITAAALAGDAASHGQYRPAVEVASSFPSPEDAAAETLAQANAQDDLEANDEFPADDYTPPSLAELCRTRASEYTLKVLQEQTTRRTTIERGTAGLAYMRDELCSLAQQLLIPGEHGPVEVAEVLAVVKQVSGLQKQIGQDYRLIEQLEKHGP